MTTGQPPPVTGFDPVRLIANYQQGVWRYLRTLGCEPALADDLTQETFLAVLQKPFQDYNPAATAAYLRRVGYNLFISYQRRSGKVTSVDNIEQLEQHFVQFAGEDQGEAALEALRECLTKLTDRAKWSLEMRFRENLSRTEIAEKLEISEHGAKNLMQRAKQQLRECVERKLKLTS
jgi:RNA polymerase sigma-70 factor (ECF subfamily)